ncbi:MAG: KH domain-containing protein [Anaerolineales bacterium]|nr:KH domain-containing protein [Anaerolineales bacterium]
MPEPVSQLELTVPADDLDEAVERVCAQWGVARDAVEVEVLPEQPDPDMLRIRVTRTTDSAAAPGNLAAPDDNDAQLARQVLLDLLERMDIAADVQAGRGEPDGDLVPIILDVQGDDLGLLIGRKGETLAALQYIARLIVAKQVGHSIDLVVDVQGHKQRREEQLRRMALRMAEQAVQRQRTMTLEPMAPNERRLIHLALRDHPGVTTESVGDGSQRKVTIIPRSAAA